MQFVLLEIWLSGNVFKVNSEDPLYSHVTNRIVCQWNYFYLLLRLFWPGFEPRSPTYNGTALPPEPMRWSMIYDALAHIASRHSNQSFGVWLSAWVTNVHFADWFSRLLNRFSTLLKELSKCWLIRCLFVCLFVWGLSSRSRIFHSYADVTITDEGLQILTYARHSWPLSSEGSLAWHTYCDTGNPFIMVISEVPWHLNL